MKAKRLREKSNCTSQSCLNRGYPKAITAEAMQHPERFAFVQGDSYKLIRYENENGELSKPIEIVPMKRTYTRRLTDDWVIHVWIVINERGAGELHIHVPIEYSDLHQPFAGLELHRNSKPENWDRAPTREHCEIIGGPCWADGTTMGADDILRQHMGRHDPLAELEGSSVHEMYWWEVIDFMQTNGLIDEDDD